MLTVKFQYANGGDRTIEAREVTRNADSAIFIDRPGTTDGVTERVDLSSGDTLYVMNERGSTVARYFGPNKPPRSVSITEALRRGASIMHGSHFPTSTAHACE